MPGRVRIGAAALFALLAALAVQAHIVISTEITWCREISRIVDRRCLSCHHEGGAAFDLGTYQAARPWAKAIKEQVLARRMPPWGAVKGFVDYVDDNALTQEEVNLIAQWVEGGAPEGEERELPEFSWQSRSAARAPAVDDVVGVPGNLASLTKDRYVVGIRPVDVVADAPLRVVARRPDGSLQPLVWFDSFRPEFSHDFYFEQPIELPRNTRIQFSSEDQGTIALLTADSPTVRQRPTREENARHVAPTGDLDGTINLDEEKLKEILASGEAVGLFVCPMDPDVRSDRPAKCERCGMELVLGIPKRLEYRVDLTTRPQAIRPGKDVELAFDIRHPDTDEPLYHFQIVHEKLLHMFIVSDDLEYFLHEHPVFGADGVFRFTTQFPKPGLYRVIADFYPQGGAPQLAAKTVLVSEKPEDLTLEPVSLEPDMSPGTTENLKVQLVTEPEQPVAGLKTLMFFTLEPAEGLEPYLGAWGHMLAVSEDMVDLIHNHPFLAYQEDGRVQFNMIFPRPGIYRVWVQFQRKGVVNTAVFDVPVVELR